MAVRFTNVFACCGATGLEGFSCNPDNPAPTTNHLYGRPHLGQRTLDNPFGIKGRDSKPPRVKTIGDKLAEDIAAKLKSFPRHAFMCVLNHSQYAANDYAWPKWLKAHGFVPTVSWQNAVHRGDKPLVFFTKVGNTGKGALDNPYQTTPPNWDSFPSPSKEGEVKAAA